MTEMARPREYLLQRYLIRANMSKKQMDKFFSICRSWVGKQIFVEGRRLTVKGFDERPHVKFYFEKEGWVCISGSGSMTFPGGF